MAPSHPRRVRFFRLLGAFALIAPLGCSEVPREATPDFLGIQDCGANFWHPKVCPRTGTLNLEPNLQKAFGARLGDALIKFTGNQDQPTLSVTSLRKPRVQMLASIPGKSFLAIGAGTEKVTESKGSFTIKDKVHQYCTQQTITSINASKEAVVIAGHFRKKGFLSNACNASYILTFKPAGDGQVDMDIQVTPDDQNDKPFNRTYLTFASPEDEQFLGFGMQFTYANMKGRRLPIFSQEQGIGRGLQPLSLGANLTNGKGISGSWHTSYGGVPQFLTNYQRSFFLRSTEYSVFDFKKSNQIRVELFSSHLKGRLIAGSGPKELLERYTSYAGRMKPLPTWMDQGVIVGMQGGTADVRKTWRALKEKGVPIAAFWLQDWVGRRKTSFGSQLWWNWQLDPATYPDWEKLIQDLQAEGIQIMTYLNPFLVDTAERTDWQGTNLYQEASRQSLLVKDQSGQNYAIENSSFSSGLLDLTNPQARQWIKGVIKDQLIMSGAKGWMADFGEALPLDSRLFQGNPQSFHNRYPVEWAKINKEAIAEAGVEHDVVFFSRSAYTQSPGQSPLFWLGDQLVSWDDRDGIKTAVTGLISSGLSGFALNHSDIGGYTTISNPIATYHRSEELFKRWTELNAFTAVMRTHEGNIPEANHQLVSNDATMEHFGYFARVHRAFTDYRRQLMNDAKDKGLPLVRHMFLEFPQDPATFGLRHQFMLGQDFLVAPVLDQGKDQVDLYVPEGQWRHLWTDDLLTRGHHQVNAPMGQPAVFYRAASDEARAIAERVRALQ